MVTEKKTHYSQDTKEGHIKRGQKRGKTGEQTNVWGFFTAWLNLPDSMDVLDGIADLFPQLLLIKLHLRHSGFDSLCVSSVILAAKLTVATV